MERHELVEDMTRCKYCGEEYLGQADCEVFFLFLVCEYKKLFIQSCIDGAV